MAGTRGEAATVPGDAEKRRGVLFRRIVGTVDQAANIRPTGHRFGGSTAQPNHRIFHCHHDASQQVDGSVASSNASHRATGALSLVVGKQNRQ